MLTNKNVISFDLIPEMLRLIDIKERELRDLKLKSIVGGYRIGAAGHIMFEKLLPYAREATGLIARIMDYFLLKCTVDIKCQGQNIPIFDTTRFEGEVPAYSEEVIKADYLVFCRVNFNINKGWIIGYIKTVDFFKNAIMHKAGTTLPHMPGPFYVDQRRMVYQHMNPISELIQNELL